MRFFKCLLKLVLLVVVLFVMVLDFGVMSFDDGFKMAEFVNLDDGTLDSIAITQCIDQPKATTIPFANLTIVTVKTADHQYLGYSMNKDTPFAKSPLFADHVNPLLYLAIFLGILMIPTKKIRKIKKIKDRY